MKNKTYKPILFSTSMIHAILEGRKTMTRRIIKIEDCIHKHKECKDVDWKNEPIKLILKDYHVYCELCGNGVSLKNKDGIKAKYEKDDILWVRETWQYTDFQNEDAGYVYKASQNGKDWEENMENWKWKPSIYMPKKAARIFLKVTDVKIERLQDISEYDSIKEGVSILGEDPMNALACLYENHIDNKGYFSEQDAFKGIWESINGIESWETNPYVWVYSFERIDKPKYW